MCAYTLLYKSSVCIIFPCHTFFYRYQLICLDNESLEVKINIFDKSISSEFLAIFFSEHKIKLYQECTF